MNMAINKKRWKNILIFSILGLSLMGCNTSNSNENNNTTKLEQDKRNLSYSDYALMNL